MKICKRLQTALFVLVGLLLAAFAVAAWMQNAASSAIQRNEHLAAIQKGIYYDVLRMNDALRTLASDPKSLSEERAIEGAEKSLQEQIVEVESQYSDFPELLASVRSLGDFIRGTTPGAFGAFQARVLEMAEGDPANAMTYYSANYSAISRQRDQVFHDFATQIDRVNMTESARAQTITLVGLGSLGLILLICAAIGLFQSSAMAAPLESVIGTLDRMRQGDFSERLALEQNDEFGVVSQGLNRLADDLCELVGQVQRSGIQVNTTATQIAATAREQQSTAHEIAATTAQIGVTSKEISATSKDLVKTMNEVNVVAEEAAHLAGSGREAIARMETTMRQIMDASGSITAKLAVLSEKTTNINSVVTTITKVADQTNLLSLNAAIEAEKAGEYGLGFAVVALEIRRLADQTAVATYDIEKMVKEMHSAVAAGVTSMDKFSEEVRRGVEEVRQVGARLTQIIHQVQNLTPRFQTVNLGMHAQATGAQQISETLSQLTEAARQTADSLRQSNVAIEQLNGAARGLQTSVARFKLGLHPGRLHHNGNGDAED